MKRYTHSAIILLAALAFAGCSKTEEFQYNSDSALQIESVSGISPFALMQEPASKAVISGETLPSEEAGNGIGLFVTASDGGAYDGKGSGYTNVKYSFNGTKWSAVSPIYLSHSTGKLYGYFPYNETATDLTKIPVASSLNGADYLYANPQEVSYSNKSVDLTMSHALARLHLTIKMGDTYLSGGNLTRIAIQSKAIDSYGTMNITTGAVAGLKDESTIGSVVFDGDGVTGIVSKTGIEKDILLVPTSTAEGKKDLTLILTIDGVEAKVIFTGDKGLDVRSGVQSSVTLVIEDSGIKVTGVGVGTWDDGGSQTIQVAGHKVTVKRSSEDGIADDVFLDVTSNGSTVTIKSLSAFTGRRTSCTCTPAGKAICNPSIDAATGICTFTITDVQDDITAEVGYLKYNATVEYDSDMGSVKLNGVAVASGSPVQFFGGEEVKFLAEAKSGCGFVKWTDGNDNDLSTDNPYTVSSVTSDITLKAILAIFEYEIAAEVKPAGAGTVTGAGIYAKGSTATLTATAGGGFEFTGWAKAESPGTIISTNNPYVFAVSQSASYVAVFRYKDVLPGVFTVAADDQGNPTKKVHFSKGNLYYNGTTFNFEANQYDTTPSSDAAHVENHISHFMWCKSASESVKLKYAEPEPTDSDNLFTNANPTEPNENFAVNGQKGFWRALSGGSNGEWKFLIDRKDSEGNALCKYGVKVCGSANCLILLPDDWKWGDNGVGTVWQNEYSESTTIKWSTMEAAGAVCLPAAGCRNGNAGTTTVGAVGYVGYYWSSTPSGSSGAYSLYFYSSKVDPAYDCDRYYACAVRFVTEYQSEPSAE